MESNKKEKIAYYAILIFFFAAFMEAFGFKNRYMLVCLALCCIYYVWKQRKAVPGIREAILGVSLLVYAYIAKKTIVSVVLLPVLFMYVAKVVVLDSGMRQEGEKKVWHMLGAMVFGLCAHGFLNLWCLLNTYQYAGARGVRHWPDIWTHDALVPATQQNFYILPILALLFPAIYYMRKYTKTCVLVCLCGAFALWMSFWTDSRIPVLIFGLAVFWELLLFAGINKKNKKVLRICIAGIIVLIILGVLLYIAFQANWFGLQNSRLYQILVRDGGILNNVRFKAQLSAIRQLLVYPMGGYHMDIVGLSYVHNVWLDMANAAGLIPFLGLVIYTAFSLYDLVRLLKNPDVTQEIKYVLSGLYVVFVLYYMVEPALEATVFFMVPWTYLNGIIYACCKMYGLQKTNKGYSE